ncbi:endonuclease III [Chloroflexi bacterium TSY]|nr:endonuclease III [Chloroflexi bacterium TSY]
MTANNQLTSESSAEERMPEIIRLLHLAHPDAHCALVHRNELELLVATILSAQCTDERVNKVTPALFEKFPDALAFAEADLSELEEAVRSTGFYRNKARNIQEAARRIVHEYGGEIPATMDELLTLKGVARKTANVVLGTWFGIADGIVVDTHVKRLSNRLGFTDQSNPDKIERDLQRITPQSEWVQLSHMLIFHGRRICDARKPDCPSCTLSHLCPSSSLFDEGEM